MWQPIVSHFSRSLSCRPRNNERIADTALSAVSVTQRQLTAGVEQADIEAD